MLRLIAWSGISLLGLTLVCGCGGGDRREAKMIVNTQLLQFIKTNAHELQESVTSRGATEDFSRYLESLTHTLEQASTMDAGEHQGTIEQLTMVAREVASLHEDGGDVAGKVEELWALAEALPGELRDD